jgi:hypothetical protein
VLTALIQPVFLCQNTVTVQGRLVAEQLGEMLCPNVAKLAQEKTFARSEGMVIQ